jgi:hypothetical protein
MGALSPHEQHFIDVVMQDLAEPLQVMAAQAHADRLGNRVADRVRVTEPLALDDLDI